jgi:CheY-like chemotaxis protein
MQTLLAGRKIFYIEDDAHNREIVGTALETHGAIVEFDRWAFAEVTMSRLRRFHPDIVLLDLMFPTGTNGYEVFDAIRRSQTLSHVPVIIVSAADATIEIPRARAKGLDGYIAKPLNVMLLPEQVAQVIQGGKLWIDA